MYNTNMHPVVVTTSQQWLAESESSIQVEDAMFIETQMTLKPAVPLPVVSTATPDGLDVTVPLIAYFRTDWQSTVTREYQRHIEHHACCQLVFCNSWGDLAQTVDLQPSLIVFHTDMIASTEVSPAEFVSMLLTMSKFARDWKDSPDYKKVRIGAIVSATCTPELIKELRSTEILGIVPSMADFGLDENVCAIKTLLDGHSHWPKKVLEQLKIKGTGSKTSDGGIHLTDRQRQVMHLICNRGLSNKGIASVLKISESTVKIHVSAIMREYGVRNRTQLALAAGSTLKP